MSKEERLQEVLEEALEEFDTIISAVKETRDMCVEDRRFYSVPGAQWEGVMREQYDNKPMFEVNKVHLSVIRIINEYRNNRITVDFVSKDGKQSSDMADVLQGLYRADEQDSNANEAYDNAFEEATSGGIGAWRLRAVYENEEDPDNDRQRIKIEPIFDADSSVFFDLGAKRQDKSDAKHCFVITAMDADSYEDMWEDNPESWPEEIRKTQFDWATNDVVYVAEYYKIEEVSEKVYYYQSLIEKDAKGNPKKEQYTDYDFESDPLLENLLVATQMELVNERQIKRKKVRKYILSGNAVLEDCGYIAGKCIPIVPVYGKRWYIDNVERCMGHVRLIKDAQRLKNMQVSKLAELSAVSAIQKPVFLADQIKGHEMWWSDDQQKNYPYLTINPVYDAGGNMVASGPIAFTQSPQIPPAMAGLLQLTEQDMQEILGSPQQGDKMVSNISGKAVEMIQQRLDMQTFIYMSNFAKGMKRCGEIWLSMAKEIYAEKGREMKSLSDGNKIESVELMRPMIDKDTGQMVYENDITKANYDVAVDVGPSSSSRRAATVQALTGLLTITDDPETKQVLTSMSMMNMEAEGIDDVRDYFRQKLVRAGVVKPTEEEKQQLMLEMQNQKEDPNEIFLKAAADEATAKASQARANVVKTIADTELKRAQTEKTLSEAGQIESQGPEVTMQQPQNIEVKQENSKKIELEIEAMELENELKRVKIESALNEQAKQLSGTVEEANRTLLMATQALEKATGEHSEKENNNHVEKQIASMSEAISKVGDAIKEFSSVSTQNTQSALSMIGKPKKLVRENGRIARIETE
jgi:hypothetical protein